MATAAELIERLGVNVDALDVILLGDQNATVEVQGQEKPSIAKAMSERFESYRTISTATPTTIPRDGEEWIVVES